MTTPTPSTLHDEFSHYLDRQADFVRQYNNRVIVLKNRVVLGVYDTHLDALLHTQKTHKLGTFLIQKVSLGNQDYTVTHASGAIC